jgi:hypothetical protein
MSHKNSDIPVALTFDDVLLLPAERSHGHGYRGEHCHQHGP